MNKRYNAYRKRIGSLDVDNCDRMLLKRGFTNEVIQQYRLLSKRVFNDPDLYLGIAFWYGIRHIGDGLEVLEHYYDNRAILACKDAVARRHVIEFVETTREKNS